MAGKYRRIKKRGGGYITGVHFYESNRRPKFNGHADRCLVISYKLFGKKKWEKIGWESEGYTVQLAQEVRAKRIRDARHGKTVKTQAEINRERQLHNRTLGEVAAAYYESDHVKALKGYRIEKNRWQHLECLADKRIPELSILDIERLKRNLKGKSAATIKHVISLLLRIIKFGAEHHLCPALHFKVKLPRVDNQVTEYLTPGQAARLQEVLDSWPRQDIARMVKMAWLTGMRRGEIFRLQTYHIDFLQGIITLVNPKSGKTENIPISPLVEELLREQIKWIRIHYPKSPYVFPGKDGRQRVDCSAVERIKKAAGLPKSFRPFHGLRHHFAVQLASSGEFTLDMIGQLLTHKDSTVTQRYAHFLPEAKRRAANKAVEILTGQATRGPSADVVRLKERRTK